MLCPKRSTTTCRNKACYREPLAECLPLNTIIGVGNNKIVSTILTLFVKWLTSCSAKLSFSKAMISAE